MKKIKRAIISLSDKRYLSPLLRVLRKIKLKLLVLEELIRQLKN